VLHGLWAWHPPVGVYIGVLGFLGVFVALTRDPAKIGQREKAAWILVMTVLLVLEIRSAYQDRNEHDQQQAEARERETKSFESIASGIEGAIQQSRENFDATMAKFQAQSASLDELQQQQTRLEQQVLTVPLANLTSKELTEKTRQITSQMRELLRIYVYYDGEISNRYFDRLQGQRTRMTAKEIQDWKDEEKRKRAELQQEYETLARTLIALANRFRVQMLSELPHNSVEDAQRAMWFERPSSGNSGLSFLFKLGENATYLDNLANRINF